MRDYIQEKEILRRFDEGQSIAYIADDIAMLSRTEAKKRAMEQKRGQKNDGSSAPEGEE